MKIGRQHSGRWPSGWNARFNYAYQESRDQETDKIFENSPRNLAKINVIAPVIEDRVFLGLEVQYTSKRKPPPDKIDGEDADSFTITNLTLFSNDVLKGARLTARVNNLFDKKYRDVGSVNHEQATIAQNGRTFFVELSYLY